MRSTVFKDNRHRQFWKEVTMKKNKQGFTLVELLVVIAIIGLLSTLTVLSLNTARARARDAKRIADIKQIQTALEMYFNDASDYPSTVVSSTAMTYSGSTYLASIPGAPIPQDGTCTLINNQYLYTRDSSGPAGSYHMTYCLGSATGGVSAGLNTSTPAGIK